MFIKNKSELIILSILCVLDIVTGVINAAFNKKLNSKTFKKGILGKLYEFIIIILAFIVDYILAYDCMGRITIVFYIVYEIMSIIENTNKYVPYPESLKKILDNYKKEKENKDEQIW